MLRELKTIKIHPTIWKVIKGYFKDRLIQVETVDGVVSKTST